MNSHTMKIENVEMNKQSQSDSKQLSGTKIVNVHVQASSRFDAACDYAEGFTLAYLPARFPSPARPSPELRGSVLGGWCTHNSPEVQV